MLCLYFTVSKLANMEDFKMLTKIWILKLMVSCAVSEDTCQWVHSETVLVLGSGKVNIRTFHVTNQSPRGGDVELVSPPVSGKAHCSDPFGVHLQLPFFCPFKRLMINDPAAHRSPQALVSKMCT